MCGVLYFGAVLFLFSLILWSGLVENILNNFCLAYLVPFIYLFRGKKKKRKAALVAKDTRPSLLWSSLILAVSRGGALVPDIASKPTLLCFSVQALMMSLFFVHSSCMKCRDLTTLWTAYYVKFHWKWLANLVVDWGLINRDMCSKTVCWQNQAKWSLTLFISLWWSKYN